MTFLSKRAAYRVFAAITAGTIALATANLAHAESESYSVLVNGVDVGHLKVDREPKTGGNEHAGGETVLIDFDFKNNGRGPTMKEQLVLDSAGFPVTWQLTGNSTFGNAIDEKYERNGTSVQWTDSTGDGNATLDGPALYVAQEGSPWSLGLYARALLADADWQLSALPGGSLRLTEMEKLTVNGEDGPLNVTAYALSGTDLAPDYFLLDDEGYLFASISPRSAVVRDGYEGEDARLRELSVKYSTARFVDLQAKAAHNYDAPVRITNVRIFDPATLSLTEAKAVLVYKGKIAAIEPNDSPVTPGEVHIDGEGGTLVAGLYEMHGHMGQEGALLNLLAGVTSVRDMGNQTDVLAGLIERIENGTLAGPRITRSGFIEGKSPFSSNNGILVTSEAEAIDAARFYSARGFEQIKIYNSMDPKWVPALIKEAKSLGMRVTGHVPAFTNADAMIAAGYDEMTHINQVMLGWVLKDGEDTRSLLRLTALTRLPGLDLNSAPVQKTIDAMVARGVSIDPTFAIHEALLLNRNGQIAPGMADYVDHMPVGVQRTAKQAWSKIETPQDDAAYSGAFDQVAATIKMMHERGIFIIPGTDMGGAFNLHRELELYQLAGFSAAEILKRASFDMAEYLGQDQSLGSIEKGKLADFFLVPGNPVEDLKAIKTIRMVVKDGVFYFPSEVYPDFGIKPFVDAPKVKAAN